MLLGVEVPIQKSHRGRYFSIASEFADRGFRQISTACVSCSPISLVRRAKIGVIRTRLWFRLDLEYGHSLMVSFLPYPTTLSMLHRPWMLTSSSRDGRLLLVLKLELSSA